MTIIPNLTDSSFRPFSGDADVQIIHDIIHGCAVVDGIDPYSTLENLPSLEAVRRDLAGTVPKNAIVVEVKGQPVGYNHILWWTEAGGLTLYLHLGHVLPEFRGKGIGSALLHWSESRIRELAAEQSGEAMFGANASSSEVAATRLLHDHGYQAVFSLAQMEYLIDDDLKPLPVPEGIEIRAPQPENAEKMWQARLAAYSEIPLFGVPAPDEAEIETLRQEIEKTGHQWRVAWAGDKIASEIWCSVNEYHSSKTGTMDEVHTVPEFQGKGIGRALLVQVLLMFKDQGITRVRLHTAEDNRRGAKTFYEKVGFKTINTFPRYRKPL
jgi:mycothiol synthase